MTKSLLGVEDVPRLVANSAPWVELHSFVSFGPWSSDGPFPVNGHGILLFPSTSLATSKSGYWKYALFGG